MVQGDDVAISSQSDLRRVSDSEWGGSCGAAPFFVRPIAATLSTDTELTAVGIDVIHSGRIDSPRRMSRGSDQAPLLSLPVSTVYGELGEERGDKFERQSPRGSPVGSSTGSGRCMASGADCVVENGGGSEASSVSYSRGGILSVR